MTDTATRLRLYAQQFEDQHAPQPITLTLREAAAEIERLRAMLPRPIDEAPKDREVIGVERPPFEGQNYFHMCRWNEKHQQYMSDAGYDFDTGKQRWAFCGVTHFIDPSAVPLLPEELFDDLEDEQ